MHKILVVRFSSLGDVILTTPVYKNIKEAWPDSFISVAVKEIYAGILEQNPYIDEIIPLKDGETLWGYIQKIRTKNFDILIDLHNNLRSRLLSLGSGIKRCARVPKGVWARRLFVKRRVRLESLKLHTVQRYLRVLRELGIAAQEYPPEIYPTESLGKRTLQFRILVVQTAFLGDAVLTTPLLGSLRKNFPLSKITLLCTPEIKDVFHGNPAIDETLIFDKKGTEKGLLSLWRASQKLRNRYDVALLPHRSFRSALLIWLAQIPKRIGFSSSEGRIFLTEIVPFDWKTHDSQRNLKLMEPLGVKAESNGLEISVDKGLLNFEKFFEKFMENNQLPKGMLLVGMNPGSVWKTKRWLPEYFAKVADELIKEWNCKIVLFGSTKDREAVESVQRFMKSVPINLCGKTTLKELTCLISHLTLFVTNDSGPMHIASALGIPQIAIFGPTTRELGFFPLGEKSTVVELELSCRPCSLHGGDICPLGHFKCMRELTPDRVLQKCKETLLSLKTIA